MSVTGPAMPAQTVTWIGTVYTITVDRARSGGALGVIDCKVPAGEGPPVHVHHNEDEAIHILEGAYEFWLDGAVIPVAAGGTIFLPRGIPHTFRVSPAGPGRNLTVVTPGGFEGFFVDAAAAALRIPEDMPDLLALAARYGLEFRGPPRWDG